MGRIKFTPTGPSYYGRGTAQSLQEEGLGEDGTFADAPYLSITTEPSGAVDNIAFTTQPVIQLRDGNGDPLSISGATITASKASGSGTLAGTLTANTNASGVATFTNLEIQGTGDHTIQFTASGYTSVTSGTVSVSSAGSYDAYVSPTGSNTTGNGSEGNPWQTTVYGISQLSTNESLGMLDGTYSGALGTVKAGMTIQAVNDGQVIVTGALGPGNAGFTVRGLRFESSAEKITGQGNLYERCTFRGAPVSGNVVCVQLQNGSTIRQSLIHGVGGRYLLLAYEQTGSTLTLEDVIFRVDGGWTAAGKSDPNAIYNIYNSNGFSGLRLVAVDCNDASMDSGEYTSERLGGQGVNTHVSIGNAGSASHCITVDSGEYGRFWHDGNGTHNFTWADCESYGNGYTWGITRNCGGTTTATRFDTDATTPVGQFDGTINRTAGSNLSLNTDFLDDARWLTEMKAVRTGSLGAVSSLVDYINSFRP